MVKLIFNSLLCFLLFSTSLFLENPMIGCLLIGENYQCNLETQTIVESSECGSCCVQVTSCEIIEETNEISCNLTTDNVIKEDCICTTVRHIQTANLPNETKILTAEYINQTIHPLGVDRSTPGSHLFKDTDSLNRIHSSIASTVLLM